jgi:hypothetical protein
VFAIDLCIVAIDRQAAEMWLKPACLSALVLQDKVKRF